MQWKIWGRIFTLLIVILKRETTLNLKKFIGLCKIDVVYRELCKIEVNVCEKLRRK